MIHLYPSKVTLQISVKKASQKRHALARIVDYMDLPKRKVLMKVFIRSQFSYCPLIWMLHSSTLNSRINNIHERAPRLTYKDNKSSFKQLLQKDHYVTVHHKNLQVLVTEIFKAKKKSSPWHHDGCIWFKGTPIQPMVRIKSLYTPEMSRLFIMVSYQLST